jgi:hypothetical protein
VQTERRGGGGRGNVSLDRRDRFPQTDLVSHPRATLWTTRSLRKLFVQQGKVRPASAMKRDHCKFLWIHDHKQERASRQFGSE